jgi:hypothetical protein
MIHNLTIYQVSLLFQKSNFENNEEILFNNIKWYPKMFIFHMKNSFDHLQIKMCLELNYQSGYLYFH